MNVVILIGRLVKTPELKMTQTNIPFCNFTIAVNRKFKNENGEYQADFLNCIIWRQGAEILVKHQKKGNMIGVEGSIQTRQYESDNGMKYITEVVADQITFLESKKQEDNNYPQTDEEIDYTFKNGNPTNKTTAKSELESKPKDTSGLPF
jgi:single-strand DNA-binding protein